MQPDNPSETATPQPIVETPARKRPYQSPEFTAFGSIDELTLGIARGIAEAGGGSTTVAS